MTLATTYYAALARRLDDYQAVTLSAGSTTTGTSAALVNAATGATANLLVGAWAEHQSGANAPQQSRVVDFVPSTGVFTVSPAVNAMASGNNVVFTRLFPILNTLGADTDYRTLTNRALGKMGKVVEIEKTITTADAYAMTSTPWLDRPARLLEVREPAPVTGRSPISSMWRGWELVSDTPTASLRTRSPFSTATGNLTIEAIRPMSTWINDAESTNGLANESDTAFPEVEEWLPFALREAILVLLARAPGRPNAEWRVLLDQALEDIARSSYRDLTQERAAGPPAEREAA